jgi:hypothetical protein
MKRKSFWFAAVGAAVLALAGAAVAESTGPVKAPTAKHARKAATKPAVAPAPAAPGPSLAELKVAPRMGAWARRRSSRTLP